MQGDEPLVDPALINRLARALISDAKISMITAANPFSKNESVENPGAVKVVIDRNRNALYFSREPIPSRKKAASSVPMLKQLGLIAFRRDALIAFSRLAPAPLEEIESVDMLRFLEHGLPIRMVLTERESLAVDTPSDLQRVQAVMNSDQLVQSYLNATHG